MKRIISTILMGFAGCVISFAGNFIVISKDTKVFESPVAKDECAALNNADQPVVLKAGMAYKIAEKKAGWYVIEYSPGLRGMVMENVIADDASLKAPVAGTYKVANNPSESVTITSGPSGWELKSGGNSFKGTQDGNVVEFHSSDSAHAYTVVNLSGTPVVYNYNNSVTKFF